jgi:monovalent cation/hydrogen antiporter
VSIQNEKSEAADLVRQQWITQWKCASAALRASDPACDSHTTLYRRTIAAARQALLTMRANDEIGDNAFHMVEEELDWLEMSGGAVDNDDDSVSTQ